MVSQILCKIKSGYLKFQVHFSDILVNALSAAILVKAILLDFLTSLIDFFPSVSYFYTFFYSYTFFFYST